MNDIEKAYMNDYAASFFPENTSPSDLPEIFPTSPGAMQGEMRAIEQTEFQQLAEKAGMKLDEFGAALEGIGSISIGGVDISLRDLMPFVGYTEQTTDPLTGQQSAVTRGTPAALQQIGQGVSLTTGTGMARQLRPDMKEALFDLLDLAGVLKLGQVAAKTGTQAIREAVGPMAREVKQDVNLMVKEVREAGARKTDAATGAE
jgi:hypothetical protein